LPPFWVIEYVAVHKQPMIWNFTTYAQRELYKFATCLTFTRSESDRVEVYLDEIATAAFAATRRLIHRFGMKPKMVADPCDLIVLLIAEAAVHEWLHHEAHLEEKAARFASEKLHQAFLEPPSRPKASSSTVTSTSISIGTGTSISASSNTSINSGSSCSSSRRCEPMLPKPIPALTERQWEFIAQRLDKPAPPHMQDRLKRAIADAKRMKEE